MRQPTCLALLVCLLGCPQPTDDDDTLDDDDAAQDDDDVIDDDDSATDDDDSATDDDDDDDADDDDSAAAWDTLRDAIDACDVDDLTVLFGTGDGIVFSHVKGDSAPDRTYLIASASKWLTSITALSLVEDGLWTLGDHPQQHLSWWSDDATDPRSRVTLEQLLSFTSGAWGAMDDVPCVEDGDSTLEACAQVIHDDFFTWEPGTAFYYGPPHMQVAAAMASATTGERWNRLFRDHVATPLGLPASAAFAVPSLDNPRAAGGATASGEDYAAVLTALVAGELLSPASLEVMAADHTGDGVTLEYRPGTAADGRDWHYALGCWRECEDATYGPECDQPGVLSSPGAFGFYPFWDQARGFWGVVSTQLLTGGAEVTVPLGQAWAELAAEAMGLDG